MEKEIDYKTVAEFSKGDFVFTVSQPIEKREEKEEQIHKALGKCLYNKLKTL